MSTTSHRFGRPILLLTTILLQLLGSLACSDAGSGATSRPAANDASDSNSEIVQTAAESSAPGSQASPHASARKPAPAVAPRNPHERPIPGFGGTTLEGETVSVADLLGSRLVVLFFNPEVAAAAPVVDAVNRVAKLRGEHNFEVLGVGVGSNRETVARFVERQGVDFKVITDTDGAISRKLRRRTQVGILGVDAEGYMTFAVGNFPPEGDVTGIVEAQLRQNLRLPDAATSTAGELLNYPKAPSLGLKAMSNGEIVETTDLAGRAAVVIFFLHTCPHCHKALAALKTILSGIEEAKRPRLVAVSIQNDPAGVRNQLRALSLDYFDPYLDPGQKATDRWGVVGGVPEIFVLDPAGQIRYRSSGWEGNRDHAMLRMNLSRAAGAQVPMLLDPTGYSGNDVCGVCHEQEVATWQYTKHATAYDTLVAHTADRRTDCIGCHVVGFGKTGGYNMTQRQPQLEDVGCESCHGRGGPHLSPTFVPNGDYEPICGTCHNPTHSLGFEYESFHPRISHKRIAAMTATERTEILGGPGPSRDLLPTRADYVGSQACQSCHQAEFKTWEASPHGHAVATLEAKGEAANQACLACHTTGFGKTGGFPVDAIVGEQADLARVGCESCHGPGSEHIGETAPRVGTILSLGDKCDSCVILKVCGTCHDDANDQGFKFKVEERIEAQRHGTVPSAATRAGESASIRIEDLHLGPAHSLARNRELNREHHDRMLLKNAFEQLAHVPAHAGAKSLAIAPDRG